MGAWTVFDIETTGKSKFTANPLTFGYMRIDDSFSRVLEAGTLHFWRPEWYIEPDATRVNGLTRNYMAQFEGEFDENFAKLFALLYNGNVVTKNGVNFDVPLLTNFIARELRGVKIAPFKIAKHLDLQVEYAPIFREHLRKQGINPGKRQGTLEELCEMEGFDEPWLKEMFAKRFPDEGYAHAHGALFDTYMTYMLAKRWLYNYT